MMQLKYSVSSEWKYTYASLLLISECCGGLIPIVYAYSHKCRHHPSQIILILCVLEMTAVYQIFMDSVCLIDLIDFLDKSIGYREIVKLYTFDGISSNHDTTYLACQWNQGVLLISVLAQLNYYIVLTVDLIITLKKPFINTKKRLNLYHLSACTSTLILYLISKNNIDEYCARLNCYDKYFEMQTPLMIQLGILMLFIIVATVFGIQDIIKCRTLAKPIRKNRRRYFINHIILIATLYIVWIVPLLQNFVNEDEDLRQFRQLVSNVHFCVMLMHPSIFLLVRLREPYFRFRLSFLFRTLIGSTTWLQKQEVEEIDGEKGQQQQWMVPLGQLVQKQANQETVGNILSSILRIVDYSQGVDDLVKNCKQQSMQQIINQESDSIDSPLLYSVNQTLKFSLDYQLIEYAPGVFRQLRLMDGITYEQFQNTLRLDRNAEQIMKTQESLGKSGSFFFFSYDKKVLLKTMEYSEIKLIIELLPDYYKYIQQNGNSLIARLYGAFTLNIVGLSAIHLILMENTLEHMPHGATVYDVKGSLVNRYQKPEHNQVEDVTISRYSIRRKSGQQVLKDVNLIESNDIFIQLSKKDRNHLFKQLKSDIDFLKDHLIMDYSMLIGIADGSYPSSKFRVMRSMGKTFSFGLIDYTQQFTLKKKLENIYKTITKKDGSQISCVDPEQYYQRFHSFLNSLIIINNNV